MFEFFWTTCRNRLIVHDMSDDTYEPLHPGMTDLIKRCEAKLQQDYPDTWKRLKEEYVAPCDIPDPWTVRFRRIQQFLRCNFSIQDNQPDIDDDWNFDFEKVPCPLRGECTLGFCKPKLTTTLSARELEIIRLVPEGLSHEEIGARLFISGRTVQNHMYKIYKKLGFSGNKNPDKLLISYAFKNKLIP